VWGWGGQRKWVQDEKVGQEALSWLTKGTKGIHADDLRWNKSRNSHHFVYWKCFNGTNVSLHACGDNQRYKFISEPALSFVPITSQSATCHVLEYASYKTVPDKRAPPKGC